MVISNSVKKNLTYRSKKLTNPKQINTKRNTPRHNTVKLLKAKNEKKLLKATKEKYHITYRGTTI